MIRKISKNDIKEVLYHRGSLTVYLKENDECIVISFDNQFIYNSNKRFYSKLIVDKFEIEKPSFNNIMEVEFFFEEFRVKF
ncbi:MAG: hypothetical protein ACRDDY_03290 [Clostridium sp.]|uniref:hypothetical protein n=1 Tax=Clostridium sp. TaxID=1506 RepID=UPI003EE6B450